MTTVFTYLHALLASLDSGDVSSDATSDNDQVLLLCNSHPHVSANGPDYVSGKKDAVLAQTNQTQRQSHESSVTELTTQQRGTRCRGKMPVSKWT